jgi:hypothetical protein
VSGEYIVQYTKTKKNMKSLKEQIADKCKNFTGMMSKTCKCGIAYEDVAVKDARPIQIPCFKNSAMSGGVCDKAEFRTAEEVEIEVKKIEKGGSKTILALMAVKKHVSETRELSGTIKCTACSGELNYSCALFNGHTRGKCSCGISWME